MTQAPIAPWITQSPSNRAPRGQEAPAAPPLLTLGTMNFGKRTPEAESARIIDRAVERGILLLDTANAYNDGESERVVGRALRAGGRIGRVGVATKVGFGRVAGKPEGLSKPRVLRACDESLARLGVDTIDLYYLHVPDYNTPLEETFSALEELLRVGKIRHIGVSNYASWQILQMMMICDRAGIARPVASQVLYNLLIRQLDIEYFKFTREFPIHTTVYNALAGGLLAGKHDKSRGIPAGSRFDKNKLYQGRYWNDPSFERVEALREVATGAGLSLIELSYAWLAGAPGVDSVLIGPASMEQLDAAIEGCAKALSPEVRASLDALQKTFMGTDATYAR